MKIVLSIAMLLALPSFASAADDLPWQRIDELVGNSLDEKGVRLNPPISDEVFLKRIYMEIAGRLPTAVEARTFLDSTNNTKRDELIDALLDSEDYAHNFFNYWADILRLKVNRSSGNENLNAYAAYLLKSLDENTHYDDFVRELIATEGIIIEKGAIGYFKRDAGMPLDHLANTVRVFLGTRLECAQCHDDPFDEWTQIDFYRMAALSHGSQQTQARTSGALGEVRRKLNEVSDRSENKDLRHSWVAVTGVFKGGGYAGRRFSGGDIRLPPDYQYPDAKPGSQVSAKVVFGELPSLENGQSRLEQYAQWVTSPGNPMFTRVIVNRLWERVMGVRLLGVNDNESIDDLSIHSESLHPKLLDYLVEQMKAAKYDLKAFLAMLYKTSLYQRETAREDPPDDIRGYQFQGPLLKRASAEMLWDSLVYLVNPRPNDGDWMHRLHLEVQRSTRLEMLNALQAWNVSHLEEAIRAHRDASRRETTLVNAKIEKVRASHTGTSAELTKKIVAIRKTVTSSGQLVRELVYSPALKAAGSAKPFRVSLPGGLGQLSVREEWKTIATKPSPAFRTKLDEIQRTLVQDEIHRFGISKADEQSYRAYRLQASRVCRASAIDLPAKNGHFLRKFGQSDRDLIENSNTEPALIHSLAMMNEPVIDLLRSPYSPLSRRVDAGNTMEEKLETAYLAILARRPTAAEWRVLKAEAVRRGPGFERDVIAALLTSTEFLFIR